MRTNHEERLKNSGAHTTNVGTESVITGTPIHKATSSRTTTIREGSSAISIPGVIEMI